MDGLPLLDEFYQVQVDLQDVVHQIYQLTNSNIRERALLEKDFVNLVELMRETLATARVTVGFIRLIFNMDSSEEKDSSGILHSRSNKDIETSENARFSSKVYEVSPKNILDFASDRAFHELQEESCETSYQRPEPVYKSADLEPSSPSSGIQIEHNPNKDTELTSSAPGSGLTEPCFKITELNCQVPEPCFKTEDDHCSGSVTHRRLKPLTPEPIIESSLHSELNPYISYESTIHSQDYKSAESILNIKEPVREDIRSLERDQNSPDSLNSLQPNSQFKEPTSQSLELNTLSVEPNIQFKEPIYQSVEPVYRSTEPAEVEIIEGDKELSVSSREPSFIDSSLLDHSSDANVSIRRKKKRNFLGNSIEDSLEDIDRETIELLESGKIELSQICSLQEENLSFGDVSRLNPPIFEPVTTGEERKSWSGWRYFEDCLLSNPVITPVPIRAEPEPESSFLIKSLVLRESVISPRWKPEDLPSSSTPLKYGQGTKEIDQFESPKLLVLIDTRLSDPSEEEDGEKKEDEENEENEVEDENENTVEKKTENKTEVEGLKNSEEDNPVIQESPGWTGKDNVGISPIISVERKGEALTLIRNSSPETNPRIPVLLESSLLYDKQKPQSTDNNYKETIAIVKDTGETNPPPVFQDSEFKFEEKSIRKKSCNLIPSSSLDKPVVEITGSTSLKVKSGETLKKVRFGDVGVYYFSRNQGWLGVPKEGGNTLGMEYYHHTFETVNLPEEELEKKEIINLKCSEKLKPEMQDLSCSKYYLENLNPDVKDRLCVKPDTEIPSTLQTLHNSKPSPDLPCCKPDLEETKPEHQDLNFWKSDSEALFSKPKFPEKSCYAPDPEIVYCTSNLEEDNCIDRPSKIARLSPSVETDVVWRSIVKKPGLLTLKRLPEDGSDLKPSKPKLGAEPEPSKPKPGEELEPFKPKPVAEFEHSKPKLGAELEPSKPKPGAKKKNLSNWKSCTDISARTRKVRSGLRNTLSKSLEPEPADVPPQPSPSKGKCGTRGLFPLSSRARKSLLKESGVKELDPVEAMETKLIRLSRKLCGCSCISGCFPGSCECIDSGIQCQEERLGSPCSCSTSCSNPLGIRRFDPTEIKMHFIQTMLTVQGSMNIK